MADLAGESSVDVLRLDFDCRLVLQFRGTVVAPDTGLIARRELDDALGLATTEGRQMLAYARAVKMAAFRRDNCQKKLANRASLPRAKGAACPSPKFGDSFEKQPFRCC
jgi:hypothetical protein